VRGALHRVGALHLAEQREEHDRKLRHRVVGVGGVDLDWVGEVANPDLAPGELVDEVQRVANGSPEAVEGVYDDDVAFPGVGDDVTQAGTVGGGAGLLVDANPVAGDPDLLERGRSAGRGPASPSRRARSRDPHRDRTGGSGRTDETERDFGPNLWDGRTPASLGAVFSEERPSHNQGSGTRVGEGFLRAGSVA
jgi:hypothetical protein